MNCRRGRAAGGDFTPIKLTIKAVVENFGFQLRERKSRHIP